MDFIIKRDTTDGLLFSWKSELLSERDKIIYQMGHQRGLEEAKKLQEAFNQEYVQKDKRGIC